MTNPPPFLLEPVLVGRVWGTRDLAPWYATDGTAPIGEAWLTGESCRVAGGPLDGRTLAEVAAAEPALLGAAERFPLLIKLLFPQERLSIQVHPDDTLAAQLRAEGDTRADAKNECWYALHAEPGATVALGFAPGVDEAAARESFGTVAMESLMHQLPMAAGEMVYVPAGTVHAIGPGLVLLEVQQMSDTTYRLWDYGRPRELHLPEGRRALKLATTAGIVPPRALDGCTRLIETEHFAMDRYELGAGETAALATSHAPECLVGLAGTAQVAAAGEMCALAPWSAAVVPAATGPYQVHGPCTFVRCTVPAR